MKSQDKTWQNPRFRPRGWPLVSAALCLLAFSPARTLEAQQLPSQVRGLSASTAYEQGGLDNVNLFNGQLTLGLPLGLSTPVGPGLDVGLGLSYSSGGWDHRQQVCTGQHGVSRYGLPIPAETTNAGFGWSLHLGRLLPPGEAVTGELPRWVYVSPDGAHHGFYDQLHPGFPAPGEQPGTLFTNDGTYLRFREASAPAECRSVAGTHVECRLLEFPGGEVHEFSNFAPLGQAESDPDWRLTRVRGPFGQGLDVTYPDDGLSWELRDGEGRLERIVFAGPAFSYRRVERVELGAFGGETAVYEFRYRQAEIDRQSFHPPDCAPPEHGRRIEVDLLEALILPDGSYYRFEYNTTDSVAEVLSGGLTFLRLPTGGGLGFAYQRLDFISQDPEILGPDFARFAYGVARRELWTGEDDAEPAGAWTYDYLSSGVTLPRVPGDRIVPCHHRMTVTDPEGNATVHYFSTSRIRHRWSYGLPFTRCDPNDGGVFDDTGPFLSREIYDGSPEEGRKLRSVFVEFESDGPRGGAHQEKNHRLSYFKIVYHDDDDRYRELRLSDFDGLGHYRTLTANGNFAGESERQTHTGYNPQNGTLEVIDAERSAFGGNFRMPGPEESWVLQTFSEEIVSEGGESARAEYCFDRENGFLLRQRIHAGDDPSAADLVTVYESEVLGGRPSGRLERILLFGGDDQETEPFAGGELCEAEIAAAPAFEIEHRWSHGRPSRTAWVDPASGETVTVTTDLEIDATTGLMAASRDPAGFETRFAYDLLGRRVGERPAAGPWTEIEYHTPKEGESGRAAELVVRQCPNGVEACADAPLSWQRAVFDGLGRPVFESRPIPGADGDLVGERLTAERHISYNALGWMLSESVWGDPEKRIEYSRHDRFGRPGRIDMPRHPAVFLERVGERLSIRREKVAQALGGGQEWVTKTETYDGQGRLRAVCEGPGELDSQGRCTGGETRYDYDLGGRLTRVCSLAKSSAGGESCGQERLFVYDGRGFLLAERQPELGPTGNGWTTYRHDALGNVLERAIEGAPELDLAFRFDRAGRPLSVEAVGGGESRLLEQYVYGGIAENDPARRGKLLEARRFNRITALENLLPEGMAEVVDTYRYEGPGGALSHKLTRLELPGGGAAFESTLGYDAWGEVARVGYPRCLAPCADPAPAREIAYERSLGLLTAVPGFAEKISYRAGGSLAAIEHRNGVVERRTEDPSGLERPHRLETENLADGRAWTSGVYRYDGAGNIRRIGPQFFRYDELGRLVEGETRTSWGQGTQYAEYDAFGNLSSLTTDGRQRTFAADAATNRLGGSGAVYDAAGNLTAFALDGASYRYRFDELNTLQVVEPAGAPARVHLYDADGERAATIRCPLDTAGRCSFAAAAKVTLRSPAGRVLRVYERSAPENTWSWREDAIYRDGRPLAAVVPDETVPDETGPDETGGEIALHLHLDHLGTPRQVTDPAGRELARRAFHPFGQTAEGAGWSLTAGFAGHERDLEATHGEAALDYLHARYTCPELGRFLSFDPVGGNPRSPQSWNRYSYVLNNPVKYVDPEGLIAELFLDLQFVVFDEVTVEGGSYLDVLDFLRLAGRFFNPDAPAGAPEIGPVGETTAPVFGLVQALNGRNELEMVRFGLDTGIVDTGGVPEFAIFLPLGRVARLPSAVKRFLPTFQRSTVDDVVASTRLVAGRSSRGAALLRKRVAEGSLVGVRPTQANAERILRDVLGSPSRVRVGARPGQVDVIGESFGQEIGIRINAERGNLVGFRRPDF